MNMNRVSNTSVELRWQATQLPLKVIQHSFGCDPSLLVVTAVIYDVTEIEFNGSNAHTKFEIALPFDREHWIIKGLPANRHYLAEIGVWIEDKSYFPILRSNLLRLNERNGHQGDKLQQSVNVQKQDEPTWREHVSTYSYYPTLTTVEAQGKDE